MSQLTCFPGRSPNNIIVCHVRLNESQIWDTSMTFWEDMTNLCNYSDIFSRFTANHINVFAPSKIRRYNHTKKFCIKLLFNHSISHKNIGNLIFLRVKIIYEVLLTLSESKFGCSHSTTYKSSALTSFSISIKFFPEWNRLVSSANINVFNFFFILFSK